jgi:hypothetical protein
LIRFSTRVIGNLASRVGFSLRRFVSRKFFQAILMTDTIDIARGRLVAERWRILAEKRLAHIVELYESGRWRRYYGEAEFMKIVRETKAGVESWHRLAPQPTAATPAVRQDDVVAMLSETATALPPSPFGSEQAPPLQPAT